MVEEVQRKTLASYRALWKEAVSDFGPFQSVIFFFLQKKKENLVTLQLMAKVELDPSSTALPSSYFVNTGIYTTAHNVSTNLDFSHSSINSRASTHMSGSSLHSYLFSNLRQR